MADDPWADFRSTPPDPWAAFRAKPKQAAPIHIEDVVRSAADVPIIGPLARKGNAAVNAALAPALDRFLPDSYDKLPEPTFKERYEHALKSLEAPLEQFQTEHPVAAVASNLAGTAAAAIPLAATGVGATALGLGGRTLATQTVRGVLSGGGVNAVDAALRGQDVAAPAAVGGMIGGALPAVGRTIGAFAQPVINTVRGIMDPAGEAARRYAMSVQRDVAAGTAGLTPHEFAAAQHAGTPVMAMDMGGETTRALARSAANTSPEGRAILDQSINPRFETQSTRLEDWARDGMHFPDAVAQQKALDTVAEKVNRPAYAKAYAEGSGGIWNPELEQLAGSDAVSGAMKHAASIAKDEGTLRGYGAMNPRITFTPDGRMQFAKGANGAPTYPDLQYWDLVRRQLSNSAQMAKRAGDDEAARRFGGFAAKMNEALDKAVPSYANARSGAATMFGADNAFEAGQKFVGSKMGNPEAKAAFNKMSGPEQKLFQDGYMHQFVQQVRESGDRRAFINTLLDSPAKRERLDMVLGPQRAKELEGVVRTESVMDLARGAVQGNSTTARQLAELGLAGGAYTLGTGGNILNPDPTSIMNAALVYGAARGRHVVDARVAQQVAKMLTSRDPTAFARGVALLGKRNNYLSSLRHADVGLARAGAEQTTNRPN